MNFKTFVFRIRAIEPDLDGDWTSFELAEWRKPKQSCILHITLVFCRRLRYGPTCTVKTGHRERLSSNGRRPLRLPLQAENVLPQKKKIWDWSSSAIRGRFKFNFRLIFRFYWRWVLTPRNHSTYFEHQLWYRNPKRSQRKYHNKIRH